MAGRRHWEGKTEEQQAVYQNRRRVRGGYGKSLLRRRGELVERSFAHCYETGGMRRTHENILKRQLVHVGAFNLSLILRQVLGAGTPRQWKDLEDTRFLLFLYYLLVGKIEIGSPEAESQYLVRNSVIESRRSTRSSARLVVPKISYLHPGLLGAVCRIEWAKACTMVGLGKMEEQVSKEGNKWQKYTGLIIHDLRRSAIRNMVAAGNPENWCMAISGHKTASVFRRYAIVSTADISTAMRRVETASLKTAKAAKKSRTVSVKIVKNEPALLTANAS